MNARLVETAISWVVLGEHYAWKLKKPLRLDYLDYSSLRARHRFCAEEVRLNRRFAPSVYLGVSRITGSRRRPQLDGDGPLIEYAVRMRRFPDEAVFGTRLAAGLVAASEVDVLARTIAAFHECAPAAPAGAGRPVGEHLDVALLALDGVRALASPGERDRLEAWLRAEAHRLEPAWTSRRGLGRVRECHGDLHLDNIVCLDSGPVPFDCIEFDPALRCIDVAEDLAFVVMDFVARGHPGLGWRFLDGWLQETGDYDAMRVLRYAMVYRSLVRARVEHAKAAASEAACRYLATAGRCSQPAAPVLYVMHGLPGSGKTFHSSHLLESLGAVRLRSDVERKRLHGLHAGDDSRAGGPDIYTAAATQTTYEHLCAASAGVLAGGFSVILDAAFLRRAERALARSLAARLGVGYRIVDCVAPPEVLRARVSARQGDASEADLPVLERLTAAAEPLEADELRFVIGPEELTPAVAAGVACA